MDRFGFGVDKWAWYTVSDILHYYEHECNVNSPDLQDRGDAWFLEWIQRAVSLYSLILQRGGGGGVNANSPDLQDRGDAWFLEWIQRAVSL